MIRVDADLQITHDNARIDIIGQGNKIRIDIEGDPPPSIIGSEVKFGLFKKVYVLTRQHGLKLSIYKDQKHVITFKNIIPSFNLKRLLELYTTLRS